MLGAGDGAVLGCGLCLLLVCCVRAIERSLMWSEVRVCA